MPINQELEELEIGHLLENPLEMAQMQNKLEVSC